ncbi:MAG TPA: diguanylate cyclase [Syntrophobacter fumaroxidans]|nr:diguanylate cyclase [Syntrophobacter fumaroxidans]
MEAREFWAKTPSQHILVVDDEQPVRDFVAEALESMGHEVETAVDGRDALEKMEDSDFSVVITDMVMPRMDGMQLIRYLSEHQNEVDIIAITGLAMDYKYTDVVAAGASDFITKPFTMNELEAKLNRLIRERHLREELERLAVRDPLTGLFNRRFFQRLVRKESIRAIRHQHQLFLFFLDIDRFKDYNDQNGHQAGDELLVRFAAVLRQSIRKDVDTAFRYGGDEFMVLLPYLPLEQALPVAERIRENFGQLLLVPTSLSVGIARYLEKSVSIDDDIGDMISRADQALYHAKHGLGRNRVYLDKESAV